MNPFFYSEEAGAKGLLPPFPCTPNPRRTCLRFAPDNFALTIPNTYSTITMPASLRSDCCLPSLRNAVRLAPGMSVHLHRNTHSVRCSTQKTNANDESRMGCEPRSGKDRNTDGRW
jgi:hypothetical protein